MLPETCLVLEDLNAGIQAACAAGMLSIMIPDMLPATPHTNNAPSGYCQICMPPGSCSFQRMAPDLVLYYTAVALARS